MVEVYIENGLKYRKTTLPSGATITELLGDPSLPDDYVPEPEPLEPQPDRIAQLEAELAAARAETLTALEAVAELYEMLTGGAE